MIKAEKGWGEVIPPPRRVFSMEIEGKGFKAGQSFNEGISHLPGYAWNIIKNISIKFEDTKYERYDETHKKINERVRGIREGRREGE